MSYPVVLIKPKPSHGTKIMNMVVSRDEDETKTFFTYRAQLTFSLPMKASVHIPALFRDWIHHLAEYVPDFSLYPYIEEKGHQVSRAEQAPDDNLTC